MSMFCCIIAVALTFVQETYAQNPDRQYTFHIDEKTLGSALNAFVHKTGVLVLYPYELAGNTGVSPVIGRYTISEAFEQLLRGTELSGGLTESGVLTISLNNLVEPQGQEGEMSKPKLKKSLLASVATILFAGNAAHAQNEVDNSDTIIVVGSSIGVNQSELESGALPLQIITEAELDLSGNKSIYSFLRSEPAFSGTPGSTPEDDVRGTLNLRGLGDQYTLTLLNGRRIAVNGAANVSSIPFEAVERIEVLKAGASGIYGSDAVAGVVNIVTKKSEDGFGATMRYGGSADGYREKEANVYMGAEGDNGSFFAMASYLEYDELAAVDREVTASNDQRHLGGVDDRSSYNLPAPIVLSSGEVYILNTDIVPVGQSSLDLSDYRLYDHERDSHDRIPFGHESIRPRESLSFLFSGERNLGEKTTVSADFLFNRVKWRSTGGAGTFLIDVPASNPYNPFGEDVQARYRGLDNGTGYRYYDSLHTYSGSLALTHALTDRLDLSLSANMFREDHAFYAPSDSYSISGSIEAINRPGLDALNPFGNRANSPEQLSGVIVKAYQTDSESLYDFDGRVSGSLFSLPSGDVGVAFGVSYREEKTHELPDGFFMIGDIYDVPNLQETRLGRDVTSVFGELRIPLLGADDSGSSPLELGLAARYEDYSDVGSTFDPLISLKWKALPSLQLRASYNTSFRVPYLANITPNPSSTEVAVYDPVADAIVEAVAFTGGNPDLSPEDAKTISVGVVFKPDAIPGLFASLDYYRIKQTNVIVQPSAQAVISGEIPGEVVRGMNIGEGGEDVLIYAVLTNVAARNIHGLDFRTRYDAELANGSSLQLDASMSYLLTFEADILDGRGFVDEAGTYSPIFGSLPRTRATGGVAWTSNPFTVSARANYVSGYDDPPFSGLFGGENHRVDSRITGDVAFRYDLEEGSVPGVRGSALTVGIENIANSLPPFVRRLNSYDAGQHDIRGRFFYVSVNANF